MKNPIGRVIATEKVPTTMDKFTFWTDADLKLHAFDIVKVKHIDDSYSFGVIENISHITDAQSFLTSFISSDFGDVTVDEPTLRVGMNYVEAAVSYNSKNLYTPGTGLYCDFCAALLSDSILDRWQNQVARTKDAGTQFIPLTKFVGGHFRKEWICA